MSSEPLFITGDFNIHVDVPADIDHSCLLELRPLVPCYDDYLSDARRERWGAERR